MNASYLAVLDSLKKRIEILVARYEQVLAQNEQLKQDIQTNQQELNYYKDKTTQLEQKVQKLQMTEAFKASTTDVKEAKQRINKLVKEIDRCIALLNNENE